MSKQFNDLSILYQTLPPVIARKDIHLYLGGLISRGYLANLDSQGKGPKAIIIGRRVAYTREDLLDWLKARRSFTQSQNSYGNLHFSSQVDTNVHTVSQNPPLKKKEDNLLLSKTENTYESIKLSYPLLVKNGINLQVYKNIMSVVEKRKFDIDVNEVFAFAEWELKHNKMLDKEGKPVIAVASWLFRAIGMNGYYRKPKGYLTPEEELALQKEQEISLERASIEKEEKENEAVKEKRDFETWLATLSAKEISEIEEQNSKKYPIPPDRFLRIYFKNNIKNQT